MKLSRKILPALAMLLVSAIMLTTASFAWFAMNQSVTAQGMTVNIKTESIFLSILGVDADAEAPELDAVRANGIAASGVTDDSTDVLPTATDVAVDAATSLKTYSNWYTQVAASPDASDAAVGAAKTANDKFDGYVVRYTFYVALSAGSNAATNLKVDKFNITDADTSDAITDITPVSVIVACGDVYEEFNSAKNAVSGAGTTTLVATVAQDTLYEVCVYVYYDGAHENVYTNNVAKLAGANIELTLKVDPATT